jgi:hypothetical protein
MHAGPAGGTLARHCLLQVKVQPALAIEGVDIDRGIVLADRVNTVE